jgi:hypothetical protein
MPSLRSFLGRTLAHATCASQDCIDDVIKLDCASAELPAPVCRNAAVIVHMAPLHGSALLRGMPAFSDSFIACMCSPSTSHDTSYFFVILPR